MLDRYYALTLVSLTEMTRGISKRVLPYLKKNVYDSVTKKPVNRGIVIVFILIMFVSVIVNVFPNISQIYPTLGSGLDISNVEKLKEILLKAKQSYVNYNSVYKTQMNKTISNPHVIKDTDEEFKKPLTHHPVHRNVFTEMKDINRTSDNIFFLETRCSTEKGLIKYINNTGFILNARQCCSLESTALMNLDRPVYVFHSCPIKDDFLNHCPKFVKRLFTYPNLHIVRLNTSEMFNNTPVQELYEKGLLETSRHPIEHTSDLIRLLVLWKFGGLYSDLDVVTIRSLHTLRTNWAGSQDGAVIANGLLNAEPEGVGHELLQRILEYVSKHFDGSKWTSNGPLLITPFILRECQVKRVYQATKKCNSSFTVWSPSIFYPIDYHYWNVLFKEKVGHKIVSQVKNSSFSVHIWNKLSHGAVARVNSTQAYVLLAKEFCPHVFKNCGDTF